MLKKFIGDKAFYKKVLAVSIPIMVQQGITNFVSLLDNIMVGSISTEAMSGVSIVNQFIFIFYLIVFGAISAAGIFTAQYHGHGNTEGVRQTFRLKLIINIVAAIFGIVLFAFTGGVFINLFLHSGSESGDLAVTFELGKEYLAVMLIGLLPYTISQVYASTMRETGQTVVPMAAGIVAVITNFVLNCILIFGLIGFPRLGVVGAAIATVVSRFAELAVLVIWGHTHPRKCAFLVGAYRSFLISRALILQVAKKGLPLMLNETLWAIGMTLRNQCYSTRGLDAVAAQNISSTVNNVFNVIYMALGSAVAIVIGNLLGAGKLEEAKDENRKMIAFSVACGVLMGCLMISISSLFPKLYNTGADVRELATYMIIICALTMPTGAFSHAAYFTLRSGGRVLITFLFDSGFTWCLLIPTTCILAYFTGIGIVPLFAICQGLDILKCIIAAYLLKRGSWVKQIVVGEAEGSR